MTTEPAVDLVVIIAADDDAELETLTCGETEVDAVLLIDSDILSGTLLAGMVDVVVDRTFWSWACCRFFMF
jgi:hypothetical protein